MESNDKSKCAVPFEMDLSKSGDFVNIIHPCTAFAQRAGFKSWDSVLEAIKTGKIVTATNPCIGRSMLDFNLFVEQIQASNLVMFAHGFGLISIGLREHFPAETLKRIEKDSARRGALKPYGML